MAKVLVVDDEFGVAEVLEAMLSDSGHRVLTAINGKRGIEALRQESVDLVFLDFMMPVLDGPGMLRAMRADPALAKIPVVLMSSLPEATVRERTEGYSLFIRKPFSMDGILDAADTALSNRGQAAE